MKFRARKFGYPTKEVREVFRNEVLFKMSLNLPFELSKSHHRTEYLSSMLRVVIASAAFPADENKVVVAIIIEKWVTL